MVSLKLFGQMVHTNPTILEWNMLYEVEHAIIFNWVFKHVFLETGKQSSVSNIMKNWTLTKRKAKGQKLCLSIPIKTPPHHTPQKVKPETYTDQILTKFSVPACQIFTMSLTLNLTLTLTFESMLTWSELCLSQSWACLSVIPGPTIEKRFMKYFKLKICW